MNVEIKNLKLIKNSLVRQNLNSLIGDMEDIFTENRLKQGMIFSSFKDSVNGQILISLDKKPDHYVNTLGDFYIDDRVGFKGRKRVRAIIESIREELMKIVKQYTPKIIVGDIVKPSSMYPSNVVLRDRLKLNPNLKLKIVTMEKGLDPHYIGYYAVNSDQKPFKKNWFYVGNNDIIKENH